VKRTVTILVWVLIAVALVVGLAKVRAQRVHQLQTTPLVQPAVTPVRVATARQGHVATAIDEQATLVSETESAVAPQVLARCLAVYKHEGDSVRAGEVLARLDDQELQDAEAAQRAEAASAFEAAAAQMTEVDRAREDLAARKADMSAAEASVAAQQADVAAARQALAAQQADVEGARQAVAAQQAEIDRVRENLSAAEAVAATQAARTARDKILYENKAISQEDWEASQTAAEQANASVAALKRQIEALTRTKAAAEQRVASLTKAVAAAENHIASLQQGVEAARQRVASLQAATVNAKQRIVAQQRTAAAARHKVKALESTAAMGRTRLGYTVIRAPYDAVVTARLAEPGDLLAPGQPIYRILKPGSVKVMVNVPQESLLLVHTGTPARLSAHGQTLKATVSRIYPALSGGRLGTVEIDLQRAPFGLKSGSTLEVSLQTQSADGLVVPSASLLDSDRGSFVFVLKDDLLKSAPVKVLARNAEAAVVSGGLRVGDKVVVAQTSELMALHDGQKVVATGQEGHSDALR